MCKFDPHYYVISSITTYCPLLQGQLLHITTITSLTDPHNLKKFVVHHPTALACCFWRRSCLWGLGRCRVRRGCQGRGRRRCICGSSSAVLANGDSAWGRRTGKRKVAFALTPGPLCWRRRRSSGDVRRKVHGNDSRQANEVGLWRAVRGCRRRQVVERSSCQKTGRKATTRPRSLSNSLGRACLQWHPGPLRWHSSSVKKLLHQRWFYGSKGRVEGWRVMSSSSKAVC